MGVVPGLADTSQGKPVGRGVLQRLLVDLPHVLTQRQPEEEREEDLWGGRGKTLMAVYGYSLDEK